MYKKFTFLEHLWYLNHYLLSPTVLYGALNGINCLKDLFNRPGYKLYCNLDQLLLKACQQVFEDES